MSRTVPRMIGLTVACLAAAMPLLAQQVIESEREIPVVCDADVVVVGGSTGAVEAACEAARHGARVFLLAPTPYLGADLCSTLRLWLEEGEQPKSNLAVACFGTKRQSTPFVIKAEMDRALLNAGVSYLTGCYVTDVLSDKAGRVAGVVMANRSGRQAIRAKVVIDATDRAAVARHAKAAFRPFTPGLQEFTRIVIGGEPRSGNDLTVEKKPFTCDFATKKTEYHLPVYEYTLRIDLRDNGVASFLDGENRARDMTYTRESELASEVLFHLPSDTILGEQRLETWPSADKAELGPFRARGVSRLYVLGAYADLSRPARQKLLRPVELIAMGTRIGRAAAEEARTLPPPDGAALPDIDAPGESSAAVEEDLGGIRPTDLGTIHSGRRTLPVLGRYDVVVVGGGTSGAPAGIASAGSGAKTLVLENLYELGGVGTTGLIGSYWYGIRNGYTGYVDRHVNPGKGSWNVAAKAEWLRQELRRNGAEVWFGTFGCGAMVRSAQVCGVVVATPQGRGVVLASTVIDATGNSNIAACAHAPTRYSISDRGSLNVQVAGFPERPMKQSVVNTCYTLVDDTDVLDVWHLMAWRRTTSRKASCFDVGQLVDSRERRRIVGDYTLTVEDILSRRTFPDTISQHYSNFDAAAFPDSRLLLLSDAKGPCFHADMPYRCLLPKGWDGILVVGLGASAERDAMTLVRMQADLQNQGYAAGVAAAAAAKAGGHTRAVDIRALQERLIRENVLESHVSTDKDSFPLGGQEIEHAIRTLGAPDPRDHLASLAVVLAHPRQAIPLLKVHYRDAPAGNRQLDYAKLLGILGDPTGAPMLIAAVESHDRWDPGSALTSQRKTGNTFSGLDRLVIALGFSRAPQAVAPLLRKLEQLTPESELSHYKAISLALWNSPCPAAVKPLVELLRQPGFRGHATVQPVVRQSLAGGSPSAMTADRLVTTDGDSAANGGNLNRAMKELIVAAMLYRCGDRDGIAKTVLRQYALDIHGHFARYARTVLDGRTADSPAEAGFAADCDLRKPLRIETGLIQGVPNREDDVVAFKGIPYAAAPVGKLRWREPQPPVPWQGVRKADKFGASCPQPIRNGNPPYTNDLFGDHEMGEDCLFLNVWTPAKSAADRLPILFFIHGGSYTTGSGSGNIIDGEALAKKGIIVVTVNFRLGIFSAMGHPELTAESPHHVCANYGLLDILAALKWVQRNLGAFGGDPGKVTISGQSTGSHSAHYLTASPLAKGLFRGVIAVSFPYDDLTKPHAIPTIRQKEQDGLKFVAAKKVNSLEDLRKIPALELIAPDPAVAKAGLSHLGSGLATDGWVLPVDYPAAIDRGLESDVPTLTGLTADDFGPPARYSAATVASFTAKASTMFGDKKDAFLALYPAATDPEAREMDKWAQIEYRMATVFHWAVRRAKTAKTPVYTYFFEQAIPNPAHPEFGAFHGSDLVYEFNNLDRLDRPWSEADRRVADAVSSYWANFVKTLDPNGEKLPTWKPLAAKDRSTMVLGRNPGPRPIATEQRMEFYERFFRWNHFPTQIRP